MSWIIFLGTSGKNGGRNFLMFDTLNIFYLWLYGYMLIYGTGCMVKDHSVREETCYYHFIRYIFRKFSKGSFICTIPETGQDSICHDLC